MSDYADLLKPFKLKHLLLRNRVMEDFTAAIERIVAGLEKRNRLLNPQERKYSEETAREIDTAVRDIVGQAFDKAMGILRSKRAILERTAQKLLEKETLTEADLKVLVPEPAQSAA